MDEAIVTAIATALATRATDAAAGAGRSAWAALVRLVRAKLGSASAVAGQAAPDPGAPDQTAPDPTAPDHAAPDHAAGPATIAALAQAMLQAASTDPHFAVQLQILWDKASMELAANDDATINQISGTVFGNVIQARDVTIRGDLW